MDTHEMVTEFALANYDKQEQTQRWYRQKVGLFADWCAAESIDLTELRPSQYRRFLDSLRSKTSWQNGKPISSYTLHGYAQVVKTFLHFCSVEGFIERRIYEGILDNTKMPKVDQVIIETFSVDQIRRLVAATEKEKFPQLIARDRALIFMLVDTGIRAAECCTLTLDDIHIQDLEPYIRVFGKGRKEREVGMSPKGAREVRRYIQMHRDGSDSERHVFLGRKYVPLTPSGIDQILYRLEGWSHISGVRCSAHTFRHTYATNFLLRGGDIFMLSRLLGHSNTKTTEIYLRSMKQHQVRKASFSLLDSL